MNTLHSKCNQIISFMEKIKKNCFGVKDFASDFSEIRNHFFIISTFLDK